MIDDLTPRAREEPGSPPEAGETLEIGRTCEKVWGREVWLVNHPRFCAKQLYLTPGFACSLHRHADKDECFVVSEGTGWLELGPDLYRLLPGHAFVVPRMTWHRFWADVPGRGVVILEISSHHDDLDVERLHPSGRIGSGCLIKASPPPSEAPESALAEGANPA